MMGKKGRLCLVIVLIADLAAAIVADARGTRVRRHSAKISSSSAPAAPLLDLVSRADPNQTSATAGAFPASLDLATAHTVGEPCLSTLENCEKWSVTVQGPARPARSEEHTSELQSQSNFVCRLLLEKTKKCRYPVSVRILDL